MTPANFQVMNRSELRQYIAKNPQDRQAFHYYMDFLAEQPILANGTMNDLKDLQSVSQLIERTISFKLEQDNNS